MLYIFTMWTLTRILICFILITIYQRVSINRTFLISIIRLVFMLFVDGYYTGSVFPRKWYFNVYNYVHC